MGPYNHKRSDNHLNQVMPDIVNIVPWRIYLFRIPSPNITWWCDVLSNSSYFVVACNGRSESQWKGVNQNFLQVRNSTTITCQRFSLSSTNRYSPLYTINYLHFELVRLHMGLFTYDSYCHPLHREYLSPKNLPFRVGKKTFLSLLNRNHHPCWYEHEVLYLLTSCTSVN